jgi:site-specific DNA-adenine methylase
MQHSDAYWKMRRKMAKDLGYQIDKIQAEKKSSKTEVNDEIIKHFQTLKQKTDEVLKTLNDLKYASERTKENLKEEVEKAMDDLKAAVDDAMFRYREISEKYSLK